MMAPRPCAVLVAMAAPLIPMSSGKMNAQSSTMFSTDGMTFDSIAYLGEPSSLMTNIPTIMTIMNRKVGLTYLMYSTVSGSNFSEPPNT